MTCPVRFRDHSGMKEITRKSAAQIAAAFGTTAGFWLNLQEAYLASDASQISSSSCSTREMPQRCILPRLCVRVSTERNERCRDCAYAGGHADKTLMGKE